MQILQVPKSELELAWPVALPLLRKANSPGEPIDEEKVVKDLKADMRQLWLGEGSSFACLTELKQSGNRKYLLVYMLGGKGLKEWYVDLFLYLLAFAKTQGMRYMQIDYPRAGWKKYLLPLGFVLIDENTLIKEIQ